MSVMPTNIHHTRTKPSQNEARHYEHKKENVDHIVNPMIPIQINLNHTIQEETPTMENTAKAASQIEEDDFLMECAMAQKIVILDQEEQQYEAQIMEEQMRKQDYTETE